MAFVPEGRCDQPFDALSLAHGGPGTKCLGQRHPKEPSRRVQSDSRRRTHRFNNWSDEISNTTIRRTSSTRHTPGMSGIATPDHTVPYGTVLSGDAVPGTSCQARHEQAIARRMATITLSLWDEKHSLFSQRRDSTYPKVWQTSKLQDEASRLTTCD
jgi:hypothetical protein